MQGFRPRRINPQVGAHKYYPAEPKEPSVIVNVVKGIGLCQGNPYIWPHWFEVADVTTSSSSPRWSSPGKEIHPRARFSYGFSLRMNTGRSVSCRSGFKDMAG